MAAAALFACTRCNARYPFEELSQGQQLCKECRGAFPIVKCTYCRTEFQQENKGSTNTICKKCEANVKAYGKPTACEYCNIIAAFIGSKCQRCTNSEKKYGSPLTCEQCKQRCAFDRKDDSRKKVDGKLLCWLCTLSYKRALAKAKQNDPIHHSIHKGSSHHRSSSSSQSRKHSSSSHSSHSRSTSEHSSKKPKLEVNKAANGNVPSSPPKDVKEWDRLKGQKSFNISHKTNSIFQSDSGLLDPHSSDHVVALTQLKEQVAMLQKQLAKKDQQLLAKDKIIAELKAQISSAEKDARNKLTAEQKKHGEVVQDLTTKLKTLQRQVINKNKSNKKGIPSTDSPLT